MTFSYHDPHTPTHAPAQLEGGAAHAHSSHVVVPVLNLSLMVHLPRHGPGASLQHVRRLTDVLHQYISDPRLLDAHVEGAAAVGGGAAK